LTSERKVRSNRANARASTGPKTVQGRARARHNALRHGLSLPVSLDPALCAEVEALAHEIIGTDADPGMQSVVHRIAEPQIDLGRIRLARQRLLSSLLTSLAQPADPLAEGPQKFASILSEISKQLAALDRYERRALSRRNCAIRAHDAERVLNSKQAHINNPT